MALVRAFHISGLTLWFYSNDHEPPHFHAKRAGEWEVKVHFLKAQSQMLEIVEGDLKGARKTIKKLTSLAEKHRVALLAEWEEVHPKD